MSTPPPLSEGPRRAIPFGMGQVNLIVGGILVGNLWVLEWSQSQQAFHTQTLMEALQQNILGFYNEGRAGDYVILGVFATRESVDAYYEQLLDRMRLWGLSNLTVEDLLRDPSP